MLQIPSSCSMWSRPTCSGNRRRSRQRTTNRLPQGSRMDKELLSRCLLVLDKGLLPDARIRKSETATTAGQTVDLPRIDN